MKTFYLFLLVLSTVLFSCGGNSKTTSTDAQDVLQGEGKTIVVDTIQSSIHWTGSKIGGSHNGTLSIKSGEMVVNDSTFVSGNFVLNMHRIINLDLTDKALNENLVSHLKSPDFFDVNSYPEGKFEITKVEKVENVENATHRISGNLTLKGIEKNITFDAKITKEGDSYKAVTLPFSINRTEWNVQYGSKSIFKDLTDNIINDNIEIVITIVAK